MESASFSISKSEFFFEFFFFLVDPFRPCSTVLLNLPYHAPTFPCFLFFPYLLLFLLSSGLSEQQGGWSRRVCLASGLSCYRRLNAMETKFWLHNALNMCVCLCVCDCVCVCVHVRWLNMDTSHRSSADCFCALNSFR